VASTLLGGFWRVEHIAVTADRRRALLAQTLAARGPGGASLTMVDLSTRRILFTETFGDGHYCSDAKVIVNADGDVGFSYLDETDAHRVLVQYRVADPRR
jgi:hypothetical protein